MLVPLIGPHSCQCTYRATLSWHLLYSRFANLLHSFVRWFTLSPFSPQIQHCLCFYFCTSFEVSLQHPLSCFLPVHCLQVSNILPMHLLPFPFVFCFLLCILLILSVPLPHPSSLFFSSPLFLVTSHCSSLHTNPDCFPPPPPLTEALQLSPLPPLFLGTFILEVLLLIRCHHFLSLSIHTLKFFFCPSDHSFPISQQGYRPRVYCFDFISTIQCGFLS